jgi:hypothetical protein
MPIILWKYEAIKKKTRVMMEVTMKPIDDALPERSKD